MGSHSLLQGIFPPQGSNPGLPHCRWILYHQTTKEAFLTSGSFPMSHLFTSGGHSIGASASVLPMNIQGWFTLGLTRMISLQSKGLSRVFPSTTVWKHQFFGTQPSLWSNSHPYTTTEKAISLTKWTFVSKVMSLLLNTMCRCVIAFLPRSKRLLISWLQSPSPQFWSPRKYSLSLFPVFPHQYMQSLCVWVCSLWFLPTLKHGSLFPDAQWYVCVCVCVLIPLWVIYWWKLFEGLVWSTFLQRRCALAPSDTTFLAPLRVFNLGLSALTTS